MAAHLGWIFSTGGHPCDSISFPSLFLHLCEMYVILRSDCEQIDLLCKMTAGLKEVALPASVVQSKALLLSLIPICPAVSHHKFRRAEQSSFFYRIIIGRGRTKQEKSCLGVIDAIAGRAHRRGNIPCHAFSARVNSFRATVKYNSSYMLLKNV